jgi:hypothetical protein
MRLEEIWLGVITGSSSKMAEGRGFEPPVGLPLRLISSQVPLTTQPPFRSREMNFARIAAPGKLISRAHEVELHAQRANELARAGAAPNGLG